MLKEYKEIYKEAHNKAEQIKIFLVSNIREKTDNFSDYSGTSVVSEYLSLNQQELIVESLRNSGFETVCFIDRKGKGDVLDVDIAVLSAGKIG